MPCSVCPMLGWRHKRHEEQHIFIGVGPRKYGTPLLIFMIISVPHSMFPLFFFWKALFPAVSFVAHNSQLNTFQSNFSRYFRLFTTSLQNELSKAFHTTRLFALNGFIVQRQFSEKTASGTISETSVDLSIDCQRRRRRICQLHAYSRRNRTKRKLCHPITTDSLCTAC